MPVLYLTPGSGRSKTCYEQVFERTSSRFYIGFYIAPECVHSYIAGGVI